MTPSAQRVASLHHARLTEDSVKLQKFIVSFGDALDAFLRKPTEGNATPVTQLASSAKVDLAVTFENPLMEEAGGETVEGYKVLLEMLETIGGAKDATELKLILVHINQSLPAPLTVFLRAMFENAISLINSFDYEIEDHMTVGPYSLLLATSPDQDWDEEKVHAAEEMLERAAKVIRSAGFGKFVGGKVQAYPGDQLPPSAGAPGPGTLGIYNHGTDTFWIAANSNVPAVVEAMVHETGHRVYFRDLPGNARYEWDEFFIRFIKKPGKILTHLIAEWTRVRDESVAKGMSEQEANWVGTFRKAILTTDPDMVMWLEIIAAVAPSPQKLMLDQLVKNKAKVQVFMHPVTSYSATNPKELYAEVFRYYILYGPQRIPEIVRFMFRRVTPGLKV